MSAHCEAQTMSKNKQHKTKNNGRRKHYNATLNDNATTRDFLQLPVGNVYFARSDWHKHPAGQTIILDGEGSHQIERQPRQTMKKGDAVKCPPNAKHWHGATEKSLVYVTQFLWKS